MVRICEPGDIENGVVIGQPSGDADHGREPQRGTRERGRNAADGEGCIDGRPAGVRARLANPDAVTVANRPGNAGECAPIDGIASVGYRDGCRRVDARDGYRVRRDRTRPLHTGLGSECEGIRRGVGRQRGARPATLDPAYRQRGSDGGQARASARVPDPNVVVIGDEAGGGGVRAKIDGVGTADHGDRRQSVDTRNICEVRHAQARQRHTGLVRETGAAGEGIRGRVGSDIDGYISLDVASSPILRNAGLIGIPPAASAVLTDRDRCRPADRWGCRKVDFYRVEVAGGRLVPRRRRRFADVADTRGEIYRDVLRSGGTGERRNPTVVDVAERPRIEGVNRIEGHPRRVVRDMQSSAAIRQHVFSVQPHIERLATARAGGVRGCGDRRAAHGGTGKRVRHAAHRQGRVGNLTESSRAGVPDSDIGARVDKAGGAGKAPAIDGVAPAGHRHGRRSIDAGNVDARRLQTGQRHTSLIIKMKGIGCRVRRARGEREVAAHPAVAVGLDRRTAGTSRP